jgi:hypothetical protein
VVQGAVDLKERGLLRRGIGLGPQVRW